MRASRKSLREVASTEQSYAHGNRLCRLSVPRTVVPRYRIRYSCLPKSSQGGPRRGGRITARTPVQWLSDNESAYTAERTGLFARQIGLRLVTTPVRGPQSNGMAESFVKSINREYLVHLPKSDGKTALRNLAIALEHYNEQHPHSALNYRSPRNFRRLAAASI